MGALRRNLLMLALLALIASLTAAGEERELSMAEVPAAVREAALAAVPGIRLVEAEVESTRRGLVYELEGIHLGKRYEIELNAAGEVLEVELEDEEEIRVSKLPRRVRQAAQAAVPGARLVEAEIQRGGKRLVYEIDAMLDGEELEIRVAEDGKLLGVRQESEDDDSEDSEDSEDSDEERDS